MKRRDLLALTGATGAALTVGVLPGLRSVCGNPSRSQGATRRVKLTPVPGVAYSDSALAFMERARFGTPRQAIYGMKDPNIEFFVEHVSL